MSRARLRMCDGLLLSFRALRLCANLVSPSPLFLPSVNSITIPSSLVIADFIRPSYPHGFLSIPYSIDFAVGTLMFSIPQRRSCPKPQRNKGNSVVLLS